MGWAGLRTHIHSHSVTRTHSHSRARKHACTRMCTRTHTHTYINGTLVFTIDVHASKTNPNLAPSVFAGMSIMQYGTSIVSCWSVLWRDGADVPVLSTQDQASWIARPTLSTSDQRT